MKPVFKLLQATDGALGRLVRECSAQVKLDDAVRSAMPEALSGRVRLGHYANGVLVLAASTAAWATRLRFEAPEVQARLRKTPGFENLKAIQIKVGRADDDDARGRANLPEPLSTTARNTIGEAAASMPEGPVREALERLAS